MKINPRFVKVSLLTLLIVVLFFGALTAVFYAKKDLVYNELIEALNDNHEGEFEVASVGISPFRNFPYISIDLKGMALYSHKKNHPQRDTLISLSDVYVGFDLWKILAGDFTIKKIRLSNGFIKTEKDSLGEFSLMKALEPIDEDTSSKESPLHLDIRKIVVEKVYLEELNSYGNSFLGLQLDNVKAGFSSIDSFTKVKFDGKMNLVNYTSTGVTYFANKPLELRTSFDFNTASGKLLIHPGKLRLPYGSLGFSGYLETKKDMDLLIELDGEKKNFDLLFSFLPDDVVDQLQKFKNEGDVFYKGKISGPVLHSSPEVDIVLGCKNASFTRKTDNKGVKNIDFYGHFSTGDSNKLSTSYFELTNFYAVPEEGFFKGTLKVENFEDPRVSMDFSARFGLENLMDVFAPKGIQEAKGRVEIDIKVNEYTDADSILHLASKLEDGTNSRVKLQNVSIKHEAYPHTIKELSGLLELDGDDLELKKIGCKINNNDLLLSMSFKNLTAYLHHFAAPVDLVVHGESKRLAFSELIPQEWSDSSAAWQKDELKKLVFDFDLHGNSVDFFDFQYLPKIEMYFRKLSFSSKLYPHVFKEFYGKIKCSDEALDLQNLRLKIGNSDVNCTAYVENPAAIFKKEKNKNLHIYADVQSNYFNAKELLVYNGHSLLGDSLDEHLEKEELRDFELELDGYLPATILDEMGKGGYVNIKTLKGKWNDMPALGRSKGTFTFDTAGSLYLKGFETRIGKSDLKGDLMVRHLFESKGEKPTYIRGDIRSDLLDFDELTQYTESKTQTSTTVNHDSGFSIFVLPFPIAELHIDLGKLVYHKYVLGDIKAKVRSNKDHYIFFDTLSLKAAGGEFAASGYINGSDKSNIYSSVRIHMKEVEIGQLFYKFDNFGQDYLLKENIDGRLTAKVNAKLKLHADMSVDMSDAIADMEVMVKNGYLRNFGPMHAMADFLGDKNFDNIKFGELENTLQFKNGKLNIPKMQINSSIGYIKVSGQQNMNLDMLYEIQVPLSLVRQAGWHMIKSKLQKSKKGAQNAEIDAAEQEIISSQQGLVKGYMTFSIVGNPDNFDVRLGRAKGEK